MNRKKSTMSQTDTTKLTTEILVAAGYRPFPDRMAAEKLEDWYRCSYQKRIRDEIGTRYFITFLHGVVPAKHNHGEERAFFTPSNQFNKGSLTFNLEVLVHNQTLEEIEHFFEETWTTMKLDYYEKDNES
jgi:hypothetical protein